MCFARLGLFHVWDFSPTFHFSVSACYSCAGGTLPGGTVGGVQGCTLTPPPSVSHEELVIVDNESIVIFFSLCLRHFLITYLFSLSFSLCSQLLLLRLLLLLLLLHQQYVSMIRQHVLVDSCHLTAKIAAMETFPAKVVRKYVASPRLIATLNVSCQVTWIGDWTRQHTKHPRLTSIEYIIGLFRDIRGRGGR